MSQPIVSPEQPQEQPVLNVILQFVESFQVENKTPWRILGAPENSLSPAFHVDVSADKRTNTEFSAAIHFSIRIPDPEKSQEGQEAFLYRLDAKYVVVFEIRHASEEILPLLLFVQGPSLLFPYLRELVSHMTQHSGLPPVNLTPVNFFELFQRKMEENKQAAQ